MAFVHPADVPIYRAMAVHAVIHNAAVPDTWAVLDDWVVKVGLQKVVKDIVRIVMMNGTKSTSDDEAKWWTRHLSRSDVELSRPSLDEDELLAHPVLGGRFDYFLDRDPTK